MAHIVGDNRMQYTLMPLCLDDYIEDCSVCRVIDVYIGSLDLIEFGFKYAEAGIIGRPSYDPADMLKLYIYGYLNRIRSSRRLEVEAKRNVEVMWLLNNLTPDDKTISNFRKDNSDSLKKAFREFSIWCAKQGLCDKENVAVDGTKIRANANRHSIYTEKGTEKMLAEVQAKIDKYMKQLDESDAEESDENKLTPETIKSILEHLADKKAKLLARKAAIEANGGKEISTVDPDAHLMHTNGDGRNLDACYNVQTVAEGKSGLVLDFDVTTCPDDKSALPKMAESAKEVLDVQTLEVAADKGYYDGEDIAHCEQNEVITYIPKVALYAHAPEESYNLSGFTYNAESDSYTCPEGEVLTLKRARSNGRKEYTNRSACQGCNNRERCTTANNRTICRTENQEALDRNNERMLTEEGREKYRQRSCTIEHIFGTIKAVWGYRQFLCRTRERTMAEMSLTYLAHNLRRVINIFKGNEEKLIGALV
ncbi:transposase [Clostridia bacterium]|nr:transposase [Clostridia bacterium]